MKVQPTNTSTRTPCQSRANLAVAYRELNEDFEEHLWKESELFAKRSGLYVQHGERRDVRFAIMMGGPL